MVEQFQELQIGSISKDIILREIKKLQAMSITGGEDNEGLNLAQIASLEKLTKLYCALMDDMRKNLDSNLMDKLKKLSGG